ncbi:MAG: hypothetical protein DRI01_04900, partial [Chloroflexi bacterium]
MKSALFAKGLVLFIPPWIRGKLISAAWYPADAVKGSSARKKQNILRNTAIWVPCRSLPSTICLLKEKLAVILSLGTIGTKNLKSTLPG